MDANILYNIIVAIESATGTKHYSKKMRTAAELLTDVDHYRFIAPLGSTVTIQISESK